MNIVILDDYQDSVRKLACFKKLSAHQVKTYTNNVKGTGQLAVRLRDAEVLVLIRERSPVTAALLEKAPKLKLIVQTGRIGAHVDVVACLARGITVCEGSGDPRPAAELTWALIMASMRRLPQYISHIKQGAWQQSGLKAAAMPDNFGLGERIAGKTLGIWGYGNIGRIVAQFGHAFAMKVQVWGSDASRKRAAEDKRHVCESREEFFKTSDVLSLHLRLSDATRGIITLNDLQQMKRRALLVNTSRAELIQPDALLTALNRGTPGMAAVDVYETEPPLGGAALLRLENALCTPHIGFVELDNYERMFDQAFETVLAFIEGKTVERVTS
jgi:D-3-phosphoglycerate dehydrogenase / 2-oxoglutarate reductase